MLSIPMDGRKGLSFPLNDCYCFGRRDVVSVAETPAVISRPNNGHDTIFGNDDPRYRDRIAR